ncbi:MAG: alpha/beta hydrolase [Actinobacteria bacterium]|nr:alpha/beta hydrolase [Actinomycetota bacterium]
MSLVFLALAVAGLGLTANALLSPERRGRGGPRWVPALFTGELAPFHAAAHLGLAGGCAATGWAGGWAGTAGLAASGLSLAGLGAIQARAGRARRVMEAAAGEVLGAPVRLPSLRLSRLLRPYPRVPRSVEVARHLAYGPDPAHQADRYRLRGHRGPAPVLVQVHGGGWTGGRRGWQGRPLMHRLARQGWVVFDLEYRLSPRATFPDQLIDVKRAIGWIRATAAAHGADASFVAVTGGSAGGQLAALAALTAGDPAYQPGFEEADTSVQACLPIYGVHDLLLEEGRPRWPYLASHVLKITPDQDPEAWRRASPARRASADRPPLLVAHGGADSLVSPGDSRRLVAELRAAGGPPVGYAEFPGATHGFDSIHSVRGERLAAGAALVLTVLWERHRTGRGGEGAARSVAVGADPHPHGARSAVLLGHLEDDPLAGAETAEDAPG